MKWMLIMFVFNVQPNGDLDDHLMAHKLYASKEACDNAATELVKKLEQPLKSLSTCMPQNAFDEPVPK